MYGGNLHVSAGVSVGNDCPMRFFKCSNDDIAFEIGSGRGAFELVYSERALTQFIELAREALAAPTEE